MAPTFYGVLGVGPDADREDIERGYRERVTEVHPDVNDDPDADLQFKRLTTARDTLLDADERSRYDRLGHASYVRHHVSCSGWDDAVPERGRSRSSDGTGSNDTERRGGSERRPRSRDWNTGRWRAGHEGAAGPARGARRGGHGGSATGRTDERAAATNAGSSAAATGRGTERSTGGDGRRTGGESSVSDDGRSADWSSTTRDQGGRSSEGAASGGSAGTYASSSFWESQRVGHQFGARDRPGDPLTVRFFRAFQALGVWALIHVVFLAAAVGTSWYVYAVVLDASTDSLALLVVLVGEVVLAAALSSVHVATRVYR